MRINIAASHRFHLLDLARELEKNGHDVRFYSYVPTSRAQKFGLKRKNSYSLYILMIPFLALTKLSKNSSWSIKLINRILDLYLSLFMKPCDIFIALGAIYKSSLLSAEKKYGATTILEWGSKHILEHNKAIGKSTDLNDYFVKRSIDGYNIAQFISIPSEHVKRIFIQHRISEEKLLVNPYGVDLDMFHSTILEETPFDVIMVGGWSYTKGCDLITAFFSETKLTFLHVGSIGNYNFPDRENMTHVDSVDQKKLVDYYKKAKVFVLPSRSDGFGMVLLQALACGLPIVCSKDTGGPDLKALLPDKRWIIEMDEFTADSLRKSIESGIELSNTQSGLRAYVNEDNLKKDFTWEAYGNRYSNNLNRIHAFKSQIFGK